MQDYLEHYRNRDDYYHRSCLEHANSMLFKRFSIVVVLVVLSGVCAWVFLAGVGKAQSVGEDLKRQMSEMGTLQMQAFKNMPQESREKLLNNLSPEEKRALMEGMKPR